MWREYGETIEQFYCSSALETEGPYCTHGDEIMDDHWSCCGALARDAPCSLPRPPEIRLPPETPLLPQACGTRVRAMRDITLGETVVARRGEQGGSEWRVRGASAFRAGAPG
eukprot:gene2541-biopygen4317